MNRRTIDDESTGKGRKGRKGKERKNSNIATSSESLDPLMTDQEPRRDASAPPVSGLVKASSLPDTPQQMLANAICNDCLVANGNTFSNYPKERKRAQELARLCFARCPDDPYTFAAEIVKTFQGLKASGDKFWRGQPFLPSTLAASGIFDRIIEAGRTAKPDLSADWLDDIEAAR
jgi:hypothetical protein